MLDRRARARPSIYVARFQCKVGSLSVPIQIPLRIHRQGILETAFVPLQVRRPGRSHYSAENIRYFIIFRYQLSQTAPKVDFHHFLRAESANATWPEAYTIGSRCNPSLIFLFVMSQPWSGALAATANELLYGFHSFAACSPHPNFRARNVNVGRTMQIPVDLLSEYLF